MLGAVAVLAAVLAMPGTRWRLRILMGKAQGQYSDLTWSETLQWLRPHSSVYLRPLLENPNPFASLTNPYADGLSEVRLRTEAQVAQGAATFRQRCATCHGADGSGGVAGPDLTGVLRHGQSDWALFRTVSRGLPGTAMPGQDLEARALWLLVSHLRDLQRSRPAAAGEAGRSYPRVPFERILKAESEPANWLTYSGSYSSQRFSRLDEINRGNVEALRVDWITQLPTAEQLVETSPIVVDGVMYVTEPPSTVRALDASSGRTLWSYTRPLPDRLAVCCGRVNRGVAVLDDRVYVGTIDAHLIALSAQTGQVVWDVEVARAADGYSITAAPLAVKDMVVTGIAGGEFGIRGFVDAYDARTGARRWRFYTVPAPGEPGNETWAAESWRTGGAPTWVTGAYDAEQDAILWGVGNPGPQFQGDVRDGDNLYSNCVIALDSDSGRLLWYFQFTPHDEHDWDAAQIPLLVDAVDGGEPARLLLWPNRNAFYYVLGREDGRFIRARPFAKQTWAERLDATGRPVMSPDSTPTEEGQLIWPGVTGGTNWWSPSYSPETRLVYVPYLEKPGIYFKGGVEYVPGALFEGSSAQRVPDVAHTTGVRALEALTGVLRWQNQLDQRKTWSAVGGVLSTAGGLVFVGDLDRFYALDAETGETLWSLGLGGNVIAAPISFAVGGRQRVSIAAGRSIFTFGLPAPREQTDPIGR